MDLNKIKQILKGTGDSCIIMEGGEPSLVIMDFREYERRQQGSAMSLKKASLTAAEEHDFDIIAASFETERMRERGHQQEEPAYRPRASDMTAKRENGYPDSRLPEKESSHIRLEDLPL